MTSFTFLVPDEAAARFDQIAEGQGGRSALLRRLVGAVLDGESSAPMPIVPARSARADQRIELLLTEAEVAAIEAHAQARGMKRAAWLVALVRRRLHQKPQPALPDAKALEGIRGELRRIGVNVNQMAHLLNAGGSGPTSEALSALQADLNALIGAVGSARRGDLAYWDTAE